MDYFSYLVGRRLASALAIWAGENEMLLGSKKFLLIPVDQTALSTCRSDLSSNLEIFEESNSDNYIKSSVN